MKSSFEELLRDLQIISKELFLSSWNLASATNLNTAFQKEEPELCVQALLFIHRESGEQGFDKHESL